MAFTSISHANKVDVTVETFHISFGVHMIHLGLTRHARLHAVSRLLHLAAPQEKGAMSVHASGNRVLKLILLLPCCRGGKPAWISLKVLLGQQMKYLWKLYELKDLAVLSVCT